VAVPEAPTWAMMLLGFVGVGLVGLRKRREKTFRLRDGEANFPSYRDASPLLKHERDYNHWSITCVNYYSPLPR
jgi:PEP-CTERM motif